MPAHVRRTLPVERAARLEPSAVGAHSLPDMITYAMLAMALDMIFYPAGDNAVYAYMNTQVKSGSIDTDLLRPMGFQRQMPYRNASRMARQASASCGRKREKLT